MVQPSTQVAVQRVTPQVYNTQSFKSNGSGVSLADHLRTTHGIDPTGMSVAEQEAQHQRAHGYGSTSRTVRSWRIFR